MFGADKGLMKYMLQKEMLILIHY